MKKNHKDYLKKKMQELRQVKRDLRTRNFDCHQLRDERDRVLASERRLKERLGKLCKVWVDRDPPCGDTVTVCYKVSTLVLKMHRDPKIVWELTHSELVERLYEAKLV